MPYSRTWWAGLWSPVKQDNQMDSTHYIPSTHLGYSGSHKFHPGITVVLITCLSMHQWLPSSFRALKLCQFIRSIIHPMIVILLCANQYAKCPSNKSSCIPGWEWSTETIDVSRLVDLAHSLAILSLRMDLKWFFLTVICFLFLHNQMFSVSVLWCFLIQYNFDQSEEAMIHEYEHTPGSKCCNCCGGISSHFPPLRTGYTWPFSTQREYL